MERPAQGVQARPQSARLVFRSWRIEDIDRARRLWGDPRVTKLIGGSFDLETRLRQEIELEEQFGVQYWPIFLRESHEFVGCAGLRPRESGIYELGFHLCADFWGRGLATEAARAVIELAFADPAITALFAGHHPDNSASRQVLDKLGFVYTHDELYPATGRLHPSYLLRR
jgi:RimJ/RimL family protein N-acetyltransferase